MAERVAVVTGANRGIGLEITKRLVKEGWHVLAGARDEAAGREVFQKFPKGSVEVVKLDVTSAEDVARLAERVRGAGVDAVINNAGVSLDGFDGDVAERTLEANFFAAMRVTDALLPRVRAGGRVVFVSSGMGDRSILGPALRDAGWDEMSRAALVAQMRAFVEAVRRGRHRSEGWPSNAYSVSKLGMTALAGVYARELAGDDRGILVNAACPGWVRTRMGGSSAPGSAESGADTPVWLATLPAGGPTGGFFRDRAPATW